MNQNQANQPNNGGDNNNFFNKNPILTFAIFDFKGLFPLL